MRFARLTTLPIAPLIVLMLLLASTAALGSPIVVGSLDLINVVPGPSGQDQLILTNITGPGAPSTSTITPLTFTGMTLSINGATAVAVTDLSAGTFAVIADSLLQGSITSFVLEGSLNPTSVEFGGTTQPIVPSFTVSYSGGALDTSGSCETDGTGCPHFDVTTSVSGVPEPAALSLCGSAFGLFAWFRRRLDANV